MSTAILIFYFALYKIWVVILENLNHHIILTIFDHNCQSWTPEKCLKMKFFHDYELTAVRIKNFHSNAMNVCPFSYLISPQIYSIKLVTNYPTQLSKIKLSCERKKTRKCRRISIWMWVEVDARICQIHLTEQVCLTFFAGTSFSLGINWPNQRICEKHRPKFIVISQIAGLAHDSAEFECQNSGSVCTLLTNLKRARVYTLFFNMHTYTAER